eukprot:6197937-Pleurochrysis_carterae.AAC.1
MCRRAGNPIGCQDLQLGCTNPASPNYTPNATWDDGSCEREAFMSKFQILSDVHHRHKLPRRKLTLGKDGSVPPVLHRYTGCMDPMALNFQSVADKDDGSCRYAIHGCMNSAALNYVSVANVDDG